MRIARNAISHNTPLGGQADCPSCKPGRFINVSGASDCAPCATGRQQNNFSAAECFPCVPGTYQASQIPKKHIRIVRYSQLVLKTLRIFRFEPREIRQKLHSNSGRNRTACFLLPRATVNLVCKLASTTGIPIDWYVIGIEERKVLFKNKELRSEQIGRA